jgi:glycine reductase complex component B subunit gamma
VGIPAVHLSAVALVAEMVGSNRILVAQKIVSPLGDASLGPEDEKELRRSLVARALKALQTDIEDQTVF